ncbi:hypothetical protein Skr01_22650 [Sphaerisporangium krabiense]|uniref:Uncharacterized protein n=1 Tax=Sphaerisporangium krabiense TaxID=763782 RepID=A0A7W8Z5Y0_9ACTN|nr:hypothetical protein [Sphaerisporangium krabiense]MBB5628016.1 hypothetical protein [Sphaerisporangium krabiense]GII62180.1 hypothetical protein Skr01_22650 [Sphaerisporangium krabiense]
MNPSQRRWDTDERGFGAGDAAVFAPEVEELAALARRDAWVTEEPEVHLVPHLMAAGVPGLAVEGWNVGDDGVLNVEAVVGAHTTHRDVRRRLWALLGSIAEPATSVREHDHEGTLVVDVITGIPEGEGPFATHGHALRVRVRRTAVEP